MPRPPDHPDDLQCHAADVGAVGKLDCDRLLRHGHIFTSVFTEVFDGGVFDGIAQAPLHRGQVRLLRLMMRQEPLCVAEAASMLGVSAPAASRSIDKLERLGLVSRSLSYADRRICAISLSKRGRQLIEQLEAAERARLGALLADLGADEVRQLGVLLAQFSVAALRQRIGSSKHCLRCAAHLSHDCAVSVLRGHCPSLRRLRSSPDRPATTPRPIELDPDALDERGRPRKIP